MIFALIALVAVVGLVVVHYVERRETRDYTEVSREVFENAPASTRRMKELHPRHDYAIRWYLHAEDLSGVINDE